MVALLGSSSDYLRLAGEWFTVRTRGSSAAASRGEFRAGRRGAPRLLPGPRGKDYLLEIECWLHPQTVH